MTEQNKYLETYEVYKENNKAAHTDILVMCISECKEIKIKDIIMKQRIAYLERMLNERKYNDKN